LREAFEERAAGLVLRGASRISGGFFFENGDEKRKKKEKRLGSMFVRDLNCNRKANERTGLASDYS